MTKQKVYIVYSNIGGGHKNMAKFVSNALARLPNKKVDVELIDIFENKPRYNKLIQNLYSLVTSKYKVLWNIFYEITDWGLTRVLLYKFYSIDANKYLLKLQNKNPNAKFIFTYYPPDFKLLNLKNCLVLVTDPFTTSRYVFSNPKLNYLVQSEDVFETALQVGIDSKQITNIGLCVEKQLFNVKPANTKPLRKKTKQVLITSGGLGLSKSFKILKSISNIEDLKIDFVAGNNKALEKRAREFVNRNGLQNITIFGYTSNLRKLIENADLVITKAGPNTIFEVITLHKPMIIFDFIWKQELGNIGFVVDNNFGLYVTNPNEIVAMIDSGKIFNYNVIRKSLDAIKTTNTDLTQILERFLQ